MGGLSWMTDIAPAPRLLDILLSEGTPFLDAQGMQREALGTGLCVLLGTARAGKTALAWWLLDLVIRYTDRPVALIGMPSKVLEVLPEHWQGRVTNPPLEKIKDFKRPAVCLIDDSAVLLNNRRAMSSENVEMNQLWGILSHLGQGLSVILTTQNLATIDIGAYRSTHLSVIVRFCEEFTLRSEHHKWNDLVIDAQYELQRAGQLPYHRDVYYSLQDGLICKAGFPEWLDRKAVGNEERGTILSKPYAYLSKTELAQRIGTKKSKQKAK